MTQPPPQPEPPPLPSPWGRARVSGHCPAPGCPAGTGALPLPGGGGNTELQSFSLLLSKTGGILFFFLVFELPWRRVWETSRGQATDLRTSPPVPGAGRPRSDVSTHARLKRRRRDPLPDRSQPPPTTSCRKGPGLQARPAPCSASVLGRPLPLPDGGVDMVIYLFSLLPGGGQCQPWGSRIPAPLEPFVPHVVSVTRPLHSGLSGSCTTRPSPFPTARSDAIIDSLCFVGGWQGPCLPDP